MDISYKGAHVATIHGKQITKILQVLLSATDYLSSPELNKLAGVTGANCHVKNLRKRYGVRIDVDDSNKAKHRWKIKEGYRLS